MNFEDDLDELITIRSTYEKKSYSQCLYHIQLFCEKLFKKLNKHCKWCILHKVKDKDFGHNIINKTVLKKLESVNPKNKNGLCILNKNIIFSNCNLHSKKNILNILKNINKQKYLDLQDNINKCFKFMNFFENTANIFNPCKLLNKNNVYVKNLVNIILNNIKNCFSCNNDYIVVKEIKYYFKFINTNNNRQIEIIQTCILTNIFLIASLLGPINNLSRYGFDENKQNKDTTTKQFIKNLKLTDKNFKFFVKSCETIFTFVLIIFYNLGQKRNRRRTIRRFKKIYIKKNQRISS